MDYRWLYELNEEELRKIIENIHSPKGLGMVNLISIIMSRYMAISGETKKQASKELGISKNFIKNAVYFYENASPSLKEWVETNDLPMTMAYYLSKIESKDYDMDWQPPFHWELLRTKHSVPPWIVSNEEREKHRKEIEQYRKEHPY